MDKQQSVVPIPDPTVLTTAQLNIAVNGVKELLLDRIVSVEKLLDEKIKNNSCLDEKRHRETREWLTKNEAHRLEVKADMDKTLADALSYRKELFETERKCAESAANKAEQSFARQIEALSKETNLSKEALSARIAILEQGTQRIAGAAMEHKELVTDTKMTSQWMVGLIVSVIISLLAAALQFAHIFGGLGNK